MAIWSELNQLLIYRDSFVNVRKITKAFNSTSKRVCEISEIASPGRMVSWNKLHRILVGCDGLVKVREILTLLITDEKIVSKPSKMYRLLRVMVNSKLDKGLTK